MPTDGASAAMAAVARGHAEILRLAFQLVYARTARMRYFDRLWSSQFGDERMLDDLVEDKLRRLVDHAYRHVPYYRRLFDERNLSPDCIRVPSDLGKIPVLTRSDVQSRLSELRAVTSASKIRVNHSGGSTGHPVTVYQDQNYRDWAGADLERCYQMAGYRPGDRVAFLWGSDVDSIRHTSLVGKVVDRLALNLVWINTFDLSPNSALAAYDRLLRFKPDFVVGYVSSLTYVARLAQENDRPPLRPRSIQTSAETLGPTQRMLIEDVIGGSVFNRYGSREVSNIAHECNAHEGLHVLVENNIVEILDEHDQPIHDTRPGRVVVTNLNNLAMPLIRYEIGDVAAWAARRCSCGRALPLLTSVLGRQVDNVYTPSGKVLYGEFFSHLLYGVSGIRQFQVVQNGLATLTLRVVTGPGFRPETLERLTGQIKQHGDPAFEIKVDLVEEIPPSTSGKYRFVVGLAQR
jgi:phenylacetate-CoA ligase